MLTVDGAVGPATTAYITDGLEQARSRNAPLVILRLDTPGGLTAATRDIVKAIRSSPVPVAIWVAPKGARAASAGTYILYASHVAAMAPATNVGAATPVSVGGGAPSQPAGARRCPGGGEDGSNGEKGQPGGQDQTEEGDGAQPASAKKRKAINDAAAWIRGLAQATGRNADWAEKAVRQSVSLSAQEAVDKNVAGFIAADVNTLLTHADGQRVTLPGGPTQIEVAAGSVETMEPDWRSELLAIITNPTVAYILMMIGIYGLLLEGYSPGSLVPGTVGAICLLLALYAFQVLPVNFTGLLLILLGVILMVSEALAPSFGVLGFGGLVALVVGSIILMDTDAPGFQIAIEVIASVATLSGLLALGLAWMVARAWRQPVTTGASEIRNARGETLTGVDANRGGIQMLGERWEARSERYIPPGKAVRVVARDGLLVWVQRAESDEAPDGASSDVSRDSDGG